MKLIAWLIAFFLFIFNGYQTFFGYYYALEDFTQALGLSLIVIVFLLFLLINYEIRVQKGQPTTGIVVSYFAIATILSFPASFNAFYSNFIRTDVLQTELLEKKEMLSKVEIDAVKALSSTKYAQFSKEIQDLTAELKKEIQNPNEPGLGKRAQEILKIVETKLGKKNPYQQLPANTNDAKALRYVADRYEEMITNDLTTFLIGENNDLEKKELTKNINDWVVKIAPEINEATNNPKNVTLVIKTLENIVELYKKIGYQTKNKASNFSYKTDFQVSHKKVGTILHTSENLKLNAWFVLSILFALILEYGAILLSIFTSNSEESGFISLFGGNTIR